MKAPTLFDTATEARDQALIKVSASSPTWIQQAHALIPQYPGDSVTGEDLRLWIEERIGKPHHFNVNGSMIMGAIRKGLLTNSGIYLKSKRVESHARRNPRYLINR